MDTRQQQLHDLQEFLRAKNYNAEELIIDIATILTFEIRAWESAQSVQGPAKPTFKRVDNHLTCLNDARRALRAAVAYLDTARACTNSCRHADIQVTIKLE